MALEAAETRPSPGVQEAPAPDATYLFSIDFEDIRQLVPEPSRYADRVPPITEAILAFLEGHAVRCTFFTTGDVARRYPDLLRRVVEAGHEVGCHTSDHVPLDRQDRESLRDDLRRCADDYARAGCERAIGFRAPIGSLTAQTRWAYEVLQEEGYRYSSSVCAAPNPLYCWPEFGPDRPRKMSGIWELPPSLSRLPLLNVPFAGGVYFRVLPFALIDWLFQRRLAAGDPVVAYLHPYDFDSEQERFMFPEIDGSRIYNWLMYYNRNGVFRRIERLLRHGAAVLPYAEYVDRYLEPGEVRA